MVKQGNDYVTGSAITGSRSTILKVTLRCDVNEKKKHIFLFIAIIMIFIGILLFFLRRIIKNLKMTKLQKN